MTVKPRDTPDQKSIGSILTRTARISYLGGFEPELENGTRRWNITMKGHCYHEKGHLFKVE